MGMKYNIQGFLYLKFKTMDKKEFETLKLIYDTIYDELNRSRDWPIKIMAFASAAYLALFSILKFDPTHIALSFRIKILVISLLACFWALTIIVIVKQHKNYLKYRNVQIRLQKAMKVYEWKIDCENVLPASWKKPIKEKIWTRCYGWLFYASYITIIATITIVLIQNY